MTTESRSIPDRRAIWLPLQIAIVLGLTVLAILAGVFRGGFVDALGIGLAVVIVPALVFRLVVEPALNARRGT